jgi:integrase
MWAPAALEEGSETLTFESYAEAWLDHVRARVRPTTYRGYEGLIRGYAVPAMGHHLLGDLHPLHVQRLEGAALQRVSAGTVLNLHLVLVQALNQAVRWGLIASNPAKGAQPPRPRRPEPVVVSPDLARKILAVTEGTSLALPVGIALATGMRRGEILGLRWGDLDDGYTHAFVRRTLQATHGGLRFHEPKTRRSRRSVALPEMIRPYLRRERADQDVRRVRYGERWRDSGLVVCARWGAPVYPDTVSSTFRALRRRAGLPEIRFHDLRHAHATLMLLGGVHPKVVSERLGHASVGITLDIYSHVLPSMQTEAVQAFDRMFP